MGLFIIQSHRTKKFRVEQEFSSDAEGEPIAFFNDYRAAVVFVHKHGLNDDRQRYPMPPFPGIGAEDGTP